MTCKLQPKLTFWERKSTFNHVILMKIKADSTPYSCACSIWCQNCSQKVALLSHQKSNRWRCCLAGFFLQVSISPGKTILHRIWWMYFVKCRRKCRQEGNHWGLWWHGSIEYYVFRTSWYVTLHSVAKCYPQKLGIKKILQSCLYVEKLLPPSCDYK